MKSTSFSKKLMKRNWRNAHYSKWGTIRGRSEYSINTYDLVDCLVYEGGDLTSSYNNSLFTFDKIITRNAVPCDMWSHLSAMLGEPPSGYTWIPQYTEHYTDWYVNGVYVSTSFNGLDKDYVLVSCEPHNGGGDGLYLQYYEGKERDINIPEGGKDSTGYFLNDPCDPGASTPELAHAIVSGMDDKTMVEFENQIENEDFYQMDNLINALAASNLTYPCNP